MGPAVRLADQLLRPDESLHAPHLVDLEIMHVLRRYSFTGKLGSARALEILADLYALPIIRYPHEPFLRRIWELRLSVTAYDAAYVALAEVLDAPLVTCDRRLASTRGHRAAIEFIG